MYLIACEESQAECTAWRELGHRAFSCDILPCRRDGRPEWHIWGDATSLWREELFFRRWMENCTISAIGT